MLDWGVGGGLVESVFGPGSELGTSGAFSVSDVGANGDSSELTVETLDAIEAPLTRGDDLLKW